MILTLPQIKDILLHNPNGDRMAKARKYNKMMRMHLYGEHLEAEIKRIDGMERDALRDVRSKYARSNKDLFSRVGRPIDKVFSARGGSRYYHLNGQLNQRAVAAGVNVVDGYSVKKWIENFWKPHFLDDPNGIIFIEIGDGINQPLGEAFPCYKSSCCIYDCPEPKGSSLDYIVFMVSDEDKRASGIEVNQQIYRVVDDAFDYYVKLESQDITVLPAFTFPNYFLVVPAILNSDIIDSSDSCMRLSPYDQALELADEFLVKGSMKITSDFMHAFPKYWEYADDCLQCGGTGQKNAKPCLACKGTGKSIMTKVSDTKMLEYPTDKETPIVTPNVAGYVEPSKIFYDIATADLGMLEDYINFTVWGNHGRQKTQGMSASNADGVKTATEIVDDMQPVIDRLSAIAESAESRDKFIMDKIVFFELRQFNYQGCSVNYGRRFMLETPDTIWERYKNARASGAPIGTLNDLLRDFIESKYETDQGMLQIMTKLMNLEPFVHLTVAQCEPLVENELDYITKLYFSEWVNSLRPDQVFSLNLDQLKLLRDEFAQTKMDALQANRQATMDFQAKQQQIIGDLTAIRSGARIAATVS